MATLYVVATPIGNLEDLSYRAQRTLREVDTILCEDTRVAKKLLGHYGITTPTTSYHQHSRLTKVAWVIEGLKKGKSFALVSDAGTPGVSDPGNALVAAVVRELGEVVRIVPIPGPNAAITAASVAGISMDRFLFAGFPPHKKGRQTFFKELLSQTVPVIFYESPYRILKTLETLASSDDGKARHLIVARELTKLHEEIVRGAPKEILSHFTQHPDKLHGEFVVIVTPKEKSPT